MFARKLVGVLCAFIVLVGCENGSNDDSSDAFEATIKTTDKYGQYSTSFVQGDEINITLSIKNVSSETKTLNFPSSKQYDFVIKDGDGVEVWKWSSNMFFLQALTSYDIAPNAVQTFTYKWNQVISEDGALMPVGSYTLEAIDIGIALTPKQELNII